MNKVFLIGNLTKDPETATTPNSVKCKFTVAVNGTRTAADGTKQTEFFNIISWGRQAENCGRYLKKGSKVGLVGSIQTRNYVAEDGSKRYITEIVADEVQFLSTKSESLDDGGDDLPEIPEVEAKKNNFSKMKPIKGGDLPF